MKGRPGLALVLAAVGARFSSAEDAVAPGHKDYYTELLDVHTTCPSAHFEHPQGHKTSFKPHYRDDPDDHTHWVNVTDVHVKSITFWITLRRDMYLEDGFPEVYIADNGGKYIEQDYDPLHDLSYTVNLDEGIDGLEKDLKIKLEDPYVQSPTDKFWNSLQETEYTFKIRQAPQWNLVVQAQNLRVSDRSGKEIQASGKKFDRTSDNSVYFYALPETSCKKGACKFYVEATCSDVATKVKVDGQERRNGEKVGYDMTAFAEKVATVECIYDNAKWTHGETQRRFYSVVLQRDIEYKGHVMVSLLSHEGICNQKLDDDGTQSFDCRTIVAKPMFIVHATLTHGGEQLFVQYENNRHMTEVRSGLPMQLQGIGNVRVILEQGKDTTRYGVTIRNATLCIDNMTCPASKAYKEPSNTVRDHICKADVCDPAVDMPFCCVDRATCEHFDAGNCPWGTTISENARSQKCAGSACQASDGNVCCANASRCDTFDPELCPEDSYVRHDAALVPCSKVECSEDDIPVCCVGVSRHTCAWMLPQYCPAGKVVKRENAWKTYCAGDPCTESDADTCCVEPATCSTYQCPGNTTAKNDSENEPCRSAPCGEKDMGTCCEVGAACSTMSCKKRHEVLRYNADSLWCSSKTCGEADAETCCVQPGTCDDFRSSCPEGEALVYKAESVLCRKDRCTDDVDKGSCCTKRDSCENFQGTCPEGTSLWNGGLCEHESCTKNVTDQSECCLPLFGQMLDGIIQINNSDYDEIVRSGDLGTVESLVKTAIANHANCSEDMISVVVSASTLRRGVSCDFAIDTSKHNKNEVAAIRTAFQNKAPLMASIDEKMANFPSEVKIDPAIPIKVTFVLLSQAKIDDAHGGIYIRGIICENDGDSWSVMLPGGDVEDGYTKESLRPSEDGIDEDSDYLGVDVTVDALTRLFRVAELIEQGDIDASLDDWVPVDPSASSCSMAREKPPDTNTSGDRTTPSGPNGDGGGVLNGTFIVLMILIVAVLLGGVAQALMRPTAEEAFYLTSRKLDEASDGLLKIDSAKDPGSPQPNQASAFS